MNEDILQKIEKLKKIIAKSDFVERFIYGEDHLVEINFSEDFMTVETIGYGKDKIFYDSITMIDIFEVICIQF